MHVRPPNRTLALQPIAFITLGGLLVGCQETAVQPSLMPDRPQFSLASGNGPGGAIAFHSNRAGTFDIWIMNADGSRATQLTDNTGDEFGPRFSPDGKQIAFASNRDGDFEIWVMNADGTGLTELTHTPADFNPTWSPDGQRIVFNSNRNGDFNVFVMNADGSGVTQLTRDNSDAPTAWSPDGRKIAFIRYQNGQLNIFVMNPDGTGVTQLTTNEGEGDEAGWSPDGKRFLFSSSRDGGQLHIFVMNADGSGVTQLTSGVWQDDDPVWSSDGKHIAFASTRHGDGEIFVMNADGTGLTQLTAHDGLNDGVATWRAQPLSGGAIGQPCPADAFTNVWPGIPQPFSQQLLVNETFDALDLSQWSPFGTGVVQIQNGKLFVQTDVSGESQLTGVTGQSFAGDFDVLVDYADFEVFAPGSPIDFGALTLSVATPSSTIKFERRFVDGSNVIWADVDGAVNPPQPVPYSTSFGQLRIMRTSGTVTLQFRQSSADPFTTFYTGAWAIEPAQVSVYARNDNFGTGVRGTFDNLRVSANIAKAIDVIGGNTGKFFGGVYSLGKVGQAFDLSKGGFVALGSQPQLSQGFTIEGWVKFSGSNFDLVQEIFNNNQVFLRKNPAEEGNTFGVFVTLADGSVEPRASSQTVAEPGVFYHLAATWDGGVLSLYVNGLLEGTSYRPAPLVFQTAVAQIGQGETLSLGANSLFGLIDEFAIADRAYTASEIRSVAAGNCGP